MRKWRQSSMAQKKSNLLPPALLIVILLFIWELLVRFFRVPHYILPPPTRILLTLSHNLGLFIGHTIVTLEEVLVGFVVAFAIAVITALSIFYSKLLERTLYPIVIATQTIPVFAIAPLLILWFGYGILPKVIMAALIVYFPIVVNMVDGLRSVDEDYINFLRILGASEREIFFKVRVPTLLPFLFSGLRIGVSVSVIGAIIGEWVGATKGLGYLMIHANAQLRVDIIFASIIILSVMAILLFYTVGLFEKTFVPWKKGGES